MAESAPHRLLQVSAATPPRALPLVSQSPADRAALERRARLLAVGGIAWHFVEFAIALFAGIVAGSIALIGFGADSLIEALAGFIVIWLFTGARVGSERAERRAQQLIASSFFLLAAYIAIEATRTLVSGDHPKTSWIGVALAAFTAATMPLLAVAKRRVGRKLHSSATVKESSQTMINALLGWWWADPAAALLIAGAAGWEGRSSWRGEGCCDAC
jgi:divalent metal cation (Fe/Co/Zn/Cd) transporter